MKMITLVALRSKLFNRCKKLFRIFTFKLRKPIFIRALRTQSCQPKPKRASIQKDRVSSLRSIFHSLRQSRKKNMDRVMELRSVSSFGPDRAPLFPSPITPAYAKLNKSGEYSSSCNDDVEDACRSFENYLVEMIVEEGKVQDLMDVEELLQCWKNLKSPVYVDLVCRFYAELCKDLFSPDSTKDDDVDSPQ